MGIQTIVYIFKSVLFHCYIIVNNTIFIIIKTLLEVWFSINLGWKAVFTQAFALTDLMTESTASLK